MFRRLLLLVVCGWMVLALGCAEKPPPEGKPRGGRMKRPPGVPEGPEKPNSGAKGP
jgi:hypothetical protein